MLTHLPIEIKASLSGVSPPLPAPNTLALTRAVKVLPSAPLRILRLKLLKLFMAPRGAGGELWIRMADGGFTPLGDIGGADDDKEIDWWLENDSEVVLYVKQ
jgi:tubulin-specific chaperone E